MHSKQFGQPSSQQFKQDLGWNLVINQVASPKSGAYAVIWRGTKKNSHNTDVAQQKGSKFCHPHHSSVLRGKKEGGKEGANRHFTPAPRAPLPRRKPLPWGSSRPEALRPPRPGYPPPPASPRPPARSHGDAGRAAALRRARLGRRQRARGAGRRALKQRVSWDATTDSGAAAAAAAAPRAQPAAGRASREPWRRPALTAHSSSSFSCSACPGCGGGRWAAGSARGAVLRRAAASRRACCSAPTAPTWGWRPCPPTSVPSPPTCKCGTGGGDFHKCQTCGFLSSGRAVKRLWESRCRRARSGVCRGSPCDVPFGG